ncbi:MAG: recombinase family protein [Desulfatiglandaceae bacterium]
METKRQQSKSINVCYCRVSTKDQNNDKFKPAVLDFANNKDFGKVDFVEETISGKKPWKDRLLFELIEGMKEGDRLIVPELSRLGRSTLDCLEIIKTTRERGINIYSVKEGFQLNGNDMTAKVMSTVLSLVSELERDFISQRTKEGLRQARLNGKRIGRPRGPGKSRLDKYRPEIEALLKTGSTIKYISKRYKMSPQAVAAWMKRRQITREHDFGKEVIQKRQEALKR